MNNSAILSSVVSVDRSMTLSDMIRVKRFANERDMIRDLTEERCQVDRTGRLRYQKEVSLVPPSRDGLTTKEWKIELEMQGWRLEEMPELLALDMKTIPFPKKADRAITDGPPILAFASIFRHSDVVYVPVVLGMHFGGRWGGELVADDPNRPDYGRWSIGCYALASRE